MNAFGDHQLSIPYEPIAKLLGKYRRRDPNKNAIIDIDGSSKINYRQLDQVTADIAAFLKNRGITKGSRIVILSDQCIETLLIWLGVWRTGAAVCPLNTEANTKQIASLIAVLNPTLVLYHKDIDVAELLTGSYSTPRVRFGSWSPTRTSDAEDEFFRSLPSGSTKVDAFEHNDADDVASFVCTSGTTGRPKIVIFNHAAYWMNGLDTLDFFGLTEHDRTLEYRSFGWVSTQVASLMPFLLKGLTMHIAKRFSRRRFFEWVQNYGITFSVGVPTVLNMLVNKPVPYTRKHATLRTMSCSTAPLTTQQWIEFEEMYGVEVLQFYGVSETGVVCGNRHYKRKIGTIGFPALHQEARIVDTDGKECPAGIEGEITIGGPKLAIGYLLDDGAIDPLLGRRIRTGDLAVQDIDGFFRITGRTKDLINRGGTKIAPLEVEEVVLKHSGVFDVATVGVPDKIYGEAIVCFVVPKDPLLTEASILQHCREHLLSSKLPKQICLLSELPRSDRGKVLRGKLKEDWLNANKVIE